jgi:hypothetical protein
VPKLKELQKDYAEKDLVIIGIHTSHDAAKMPAFVEKQGMKWAICVDGDGKTCERYGVNAFPTCVLIDKKGVVRDADFEFEQGRATIDKLLAEEGPKKK